MIHTEAQERPASEIIKDIITKLAQMKALFSGVNEAAIGANVLLSISAAISGAETFLAQYGGNQRLIDFANSEAALNPAKYGAGYNVSTDFNAVMLALANIKAFLIAIDYTGAVGLDANGLMFWSTFNATGLQAKIDEFNAVVS